MGSLRAASTVSAEEDGGEEERGFIYFKYMKNMEYLDITTKKNAGKYAHHIMEKHTLRVQKYGNNGLKHGGKNVLWPMSLVTKEIFSPTQTQTSI